ncbi:MAG TPA: hypothetical protein VL025_09840, partial [Thermoanaerobaculia bacterium]|nr:hypothetical protein [Thermoanaerobaculia bacterium]
MSLATAPTTVAPNAPDPHSLHRDGRGLTRLAAAATVLGLLAGAALWLLGQPGAARVAWAATTALVLLPLLLEVLASLRRGEV